MAGTAEGEEVGIVGGFRFVGSGDSGGASDEVASTMLLSFFETEITLESAGTVGVAFLEVVGELFPAVPGFLLTGELMRFLGTVPLSCCFFGEVGLSSSAGLLLGN